MEGESNENSRTAEGKKVVSAGGGDGDDDDDASSVGITGHEEGQRASHWTTLARLHRLHLLVSAASGVPYNRKLLERRRRQKPEAGTSNRKSVTIGGAEEGDDCQIDVDGRSRGLSISAPFPYNDNNNNDGDDDDDDDEDEEEEEGETTAASSPYIKSAIPYLPRKMAVMCLALNIFVPGTGTMLSGLFAVCCGTPRLKTKDGIYAETICVNLLVGVMQLFTITFLLVGWIWSFVWGVYMVLLAVEQSRRIKAKHKKELKVKALTALNGRLRAWTLRQGNRENN